MSNQDKYQHWLEGTKADKAAQKELVSIAKDQNAIEDRFFADLEFGTGGLRGRLGYGTNRMNQYVVARATQGLADYLNKHFEHPSCVIGFDSRHYSNEFAKKAASVLAGNGIEVYLFKELVPTPVVSFSVKNLKCSAGIVITASHNPKEYNGYKAYGDDGAQINVEMADEVYSGIQALDYFTGIKELELRKAEKEGLVHIIYQELFDRFIESTMKQSLETKDPRTLNIVYTPLHGSGLKFVTEALRRDGFNNIHVVKEQELPDGNFPTASYPNPEMKEALELGIRDLENLDYDILIATDPDADRVGVAVSADAGTKIMTGNEIGLLLFDFIYNTKKEAGTLSNNPILVKTIVSSDLAMLMAREYGVTVINVLTGFKFIGEQIKILEEKGEKDRYLLGFEESCGYLTNTDVRDKDSVNAALLIAEMANHYKQQGLTLYDKITELYKQYGKYKSLTVSYTFEGESGKTTMDKIMAFFRDNNNDVSFGKILAKYDYLTKVGYYSIEGKALDLPASDVIQYFFLDHSSITIRPSGTEPKIKFYFFLSPDPKNNLQDTIMSIVSHAKEL